MASVVVFLDWQNVYQSARESFHVRGAPASCGQVDPLALGRRIVAQIPGGELAQVRVYRGLPDNGKDQRSYAAVRAQTAAWTRAGGETLDVTLLPLQYDVGQRPREKGVDVKLAIDYVAMAMRGEYDIGVLFSMDTDLRPALETVYDLNGDAKPWPRTAGWDGPNQPRRSIRPRGGRVAPCIWLDAIEYARVRDRRRYGK